MHVNCKSFPQTFIINILGLHLCMIDTLMYMEKEKRLTLRKKLTNLLIKTPLGALSKVWHFYANNMVLSSVNMGSTSLYPGHPFRRKAIYRTKAAATFTKAAGRSKMGGRSVVVAPRETDKTTGRPTIRGCPPCTSVVATPFVHQGASNPRREETSQAGVQPWAGRQRWAATKLPERISSNQ